MGKCQPWWNAQHEMNKQQMHPTWYNGRKDGHKKLMRKTRWKHTFFCCHISHMHAHTHTKTKAAIRIGIQQSMHSAMVTMHACYKSPSVRAFSGEMAGVGRLNGTLPGYLCLHFFVQATKREIHLSRGRNRLPGLGQHIATSLSASFEVAATEAHPLSLTTSN